MLQACADSGYPSKPRQEVGHETSQRSWKGHRSQVSVHEIPDVSTRATGAGSEPDNSNPARALPGVGQR